MMDQPGSDLSKAFAARAGGCAAPGLSAVFSVAFACDDLGCRPRGLPGVRGTKPGGREVLQVVRGGTRVAL